MGRQRDPIWRHFSASNPLAKGRHHRAKCNYCKHEMTGQPRRLYNHLTICNDIPAAELEVLLERRKEQTKLAKYNDLSNKVEEFMHSNATKLMDDSYTSATPHSSAAGLESRPTGTTATSADDARVFNCNEMRDENRSSRLSSTSARDSIQGSPCFDQDDMDGMIAKLLYEAGIPLSKMENPSMVELFRMLNPGYEPGSQKRMQESMGCPWINGRKVNILLASTGSVASLKLPELAVRLSNIANVRIVTTKASDHFIENVKNYDPYFFKLFQAAEPPFQVLSDKDEWEKWQEIGDSVLHIELREWADILVIAPLSANTMAKIANGLCDNLLTCIVRAWDMKKPIVVAPAMNTHMWNNPHTQKHIKALKELSIDIIDPISKVLACGDKGKGAMAKVDDVINEVFDKIMNYSVTMEKSEECSNV